MQPTCAKCRRVIDRNEAHFESDERDAFYCFKCGSRRSERASNQEHCGISIVMLALCVLLLVWTAAVAIF